jgi:hypothetical protein
MLRQIPDARVVTLGGFGTADVELILAANDGEALEVAAERLQREMRQLSVISDVRTATPPPGA